MSDEIKNSEKKSKSIMRNTKAVRYSKNLMFVAGAMGVTTGVLFSNTPKAEPNKKNKDENLKNTVNETQFMLKNMRNRNKMYIRGANLELIQLMEQGDQVIKSPWRSWQFGMNFFSNADIISGDGYGDKQEKYTYNSLYFRNNWKMKNALVSDDSIGVTGLPITPGNESQVSWRTANGNIYSGMNFDTSKGSSVNGEVRWGLVELRDIHEPLNEVEILARISPKEVKKESVSLSVAQPTVEPVGAPKIEPNITPPLEAPKITIPDVTVDITPNEPSVTVDVNRPELNPLTITQPAVVNVTPPTVATIEPVAFSVAPTIDATERPNPATTYKIGGTNQGKLDTRFPPNNPNNPTNPINIDVTSKSESLRNYFTFANVVPSTTQNPTVKLRENVTINVKVDDARAIVIDEPENDSKFEMSGTINLYETKNMGIDLQGKANGSGEVLATILNTGTITGHYVNGNGNENKNQIAFGFSNVDASRNNTMSHIINKGTISLNAPQSAGMQLKPEDPHNWQPEWKHLNNNNLVTINSKSPDSSKGRVLMKADNQNIINIESSGSFGIITVFNPGISELDTVSMGTGINKTESNLKAKRDLGTPKKPFVILPGGEIGRSASLKSEWTSGVYNSGDININGDNSVGVGILHEIQEVKVGGKINIGTIAVTQGDNQNLTGGNKKKVENAVGIYAGVPTRPLLKGETGTYGGMAPADIGTKTVEFGPFGETGASTGAVAGSGTITVGEHATKSIGLLVGDSEENLNNGKLNGVDTTDRKLKRSGSITANEGANIVVNGDSNYGFVVSSESYKSEFIDIIEPTGKTVDNLYTTIDKKNYGVGINKGTITVNGKNSIAFAMLKGGDSSNSGDLIVNPLTASGVQKSTAFYGEQGKFANSGNITVNTPANTGNIGVLLKGPNTATPINFTNTGNISVQGKGNIGVYGEGKYTFNHEKNDTGTNKISVGTNAVGIYAKNEGILNIKAPIDIADSGTGVNAGTTIGIVSDGNANVNFGTGSKLTIGEKAVGIYSANSKKLSDTFEIKNNELLEVELRKNSAFALVSGNHNTGSPDLSKFFNGNENSAIGRIEISSFGEGATLVYSNNGGKAILGNGTAATFSINNGTNKSTSILSASGNKSVVGIAENFTLTTNTKVALSSSDSAEAINKGKIISTRSVSNAGLTDNGVGIYANNSTGENASTGRIEMRTEGAVGIFGESNSTLTNSGEIKVLKAGSAGIYGKDSDITNSGKKTDTDTKGIYVKQGSSAGIFGVVSGTVPKTITNTGDIITEAMPTGNTQSAGIYGEVTSAGSKLTIAHTGNITVNGDKSVGIYAKNGSGAVANLVIDNTITTGGVIKKGTININKEKSVGIYASNSTVSGVGKITLSNDANESIGVYAEKGSAITTNGAKINLGTGTDQNRVAYYVKNKDTALTGTNIGEISGYGVGVYLEGTSATDVAELNASSTPLNYKTATNSGDGIIGLYLRGNTDISGYGKQITVGDSVGVGAPNTKYAIGIYADRQGTAGNKYEIKAPITTGANGIGIFVGKDDASNTGSSIKYSGTMIIGDETTSSGTGIYIADKPGTGDNEATLGSTSHIKLKGTNGVGVIIGKGSKLSVESGATSRATIELIGAANIKGVGIYGLKGSQITGLDRLIFENHGKTAEMVRTVEGQANIANTNANPGIVVTHVINGETSLAALATISTPANSYNNIGLMAQGTKNPNMTWAKGDYEIVNDGTINFSHSRTSTGIYAESARVKNNGEIKVGSQSTGIYGVYNSDSPKYEGAPSDPDHNSNKLTVETTANSLIELGEESVGVYLKNANSNINLDGKIKSSAGATKNVGVYMINDAGTPLAGMVNKAEITLGDGSVGLYSKGKAPNAKNTVTNTGKITVGKKIAGTPSVPSVGIYAENTNLITVASTSGPSSDITVGEDGIAFYGKHSDITAKGRVNFNNKGVLAYLENSKFVSYLGDISSTQNTMLYLKNSTAKMNGAAAPDDMLVNMTVADGYTGAYVEGDDSHLTGVRTINLGRNSNGIFLQGANFNSRGITEIVGTQANAKGILGINSSLTNETKISLSGDNSIGIYSNVNTPKTVVNKGKLELSGKKTLGVFLKGSQSFENKADISIADSADAQNPTIGVYTSNGTSPITLTSGNIEVGVKSIGVYSTTNSPVNMTGGNLHVKDEGMGIYKQDGSVSVAGNIVVDPHTSTTPNTEPVGVYAVNGATVNDSANVTVGEKSYGFILSHNNSSKVNVYTNTAGSNVTLGSDSTYLYSGGRAQITNNKNIATGNVDRVIGFYIKGDSTGQGEFVNNGLLDFSTGKGNIAVYAPGSKATNSASGKIYVGATDYTDPLTGQIYSDKSKIVYGIGMATDNGGQIANDGEIRIFGDKSIGMYGSGAGTVVENRGNILLDGSRATASNKIESMTGVYVDEGAKFVNKGIIRTADSYAGREGKVNENVSGLVGVAVMSGSTLVNEAGAKILIDADNSYGVVIRGKKNADGTVQRYATIKNYGEISVRGRGTYGINWKDITRAELEDLENQINSKIKSDAKGQEIRQTSGTDKEFEGIKISIKNGEPVFTKDGVPVSDDEIVEISKLIGNQSNIGLSDIGFYVDTLGRTKPIDIDGSIPPINSQLIIGTEYSEMTNSKYWVVKGDVIKPFLDQITGRNFKLTSLAGSLTWMATPVLNSYGEITGVAMAKVPYTSYVKTTDNAWNFTDGLEQRYGVNSLDSREKVLFNKLNSIGKNEKVLLTQAFDEMMGHQYANIQQRTYGTGRLIDKEITHLSKEWETKSKQSNKIKVFGMKDEYTTDTAGIIDYTSNAYGFAYLHEDETVKLGNVSGWYAGGVHNKFKFKDIGGSRENQTMLKLGIFKTMTPASDHNGNLQWTISGEGYVSKNEMHRKYLVVDEIFNAKSDYTTYGVAVKNEVGYNIRTSERTSIRPYGSLKVEYGRFSNIKEKSGEVRLDVQGNDYYSVKPEIGVEFKYRQPFAVKSIFTASLGLGYESELGKVGNVNNKARVSYTSADWFNIRGEKDSRKGKFKADLNFGIENSRVGMTLNTGYDSDNNNLRGGLGFRLIY